MPPRPDAEAVARHHSPGTGGPERLLWVLRHAKAVADPPPKGVDRDRRLAPRGRRDAAALGRRLVGDRLGLEPGDLPGLVLCSTARRTAETAEGVLAAGLAATLDLRRRLYQASPEEVLDEVRTVDDAVISVMVVGHNPTVARLVVAMVEDGDEAGRRSLGEGTFPTCGLAVYRLPTSRWLDVAAGTGSVVGWWSPPYA